MHQITTKGFKLNSAKMKLQMKDTPPDPILNVNNQRAQTDNQKILFSTLQSFHYSFFLPWVIYYLLQTSKERNKNAS